VTAESCCHCGVPLELLFLDAGGLD
jgi:hypothetical protein